jgi:hypothetical protein
MKTYSASIDIDATPAKIWAIITDTPSHPSFDPSCIRIQGGKAEEGAWLRIYTTEGPERGILMRVASFSPGRMMVWAAGSLFGLLRRVRTFAIEERTRGKCRFTLKEEFSGPLLRLAGGSIPDMTGAFEGFCKGLKELAEA